MAALRADRYDRRLIAAVCQFTEAAAAGTLVVGTLAGWQSNTSILGIGSLVGAARAFESPATTALVSDVVSRPLIARAMAWLVSANQTAQIVGPALGGFLYTLGPEAPYLSAAGLFVLAGVCAAVIRSRRAARATEPLNLENVFSGIAFIRSPRVLGVLRSAPAVGALATSMFLAYQPLRRRIGPTLFRAVMVFGAATVVFGVSTNFALSLAALCVLGASDVVSVVIRASLVQIRTPDTMRGRVSAVHSLFTGTSNQLGAFESGL